MVILQNAVLTFRGMESTIVKILEKRGIPQKNIEHFFSRNLQETLPHLENLQDLNKASKRIMTAMEKGEKIGIYGDYDVDGTTSCALLHHFFKLLKCPVELIQPDRFQEGYGLHISSIDIAKQKNIHLLITVDCGTTSCEAAKYALLHKVDLIITDHHQDIGDDIPDAVAIINPNRRDAPSNSPSKSLAGVGVAFCLALQIRSDLQKKGQQVPSLYTLLQFVAIGTICDQVPLNLLNLKLVRHGLEQLPQTTFPGLKVFLSPEERKLKTISSEKLAFNIGPLINSKGRLEHPKQALDVLISEDMDNAYQGHVQLSLCNQERKIIQSKVYLEARTEILKNMEKGEHFISIAYNKSWHEGVVGIVASKLVENFQTPAIVFTDSSQENIIKGSARTAGTLSIFDQLCQCQDIFEKFGGHAAAAGISMQKNKLPILKQRMNDILKNIPPHLRTVQLSYDIEIALEEITPRLVRNLEQLEPFGQGNPRPMFKMKNFIVKSYKILKEQHVKWFLAPSLTAPKQALLQGISFNYIDRWNIPHPQETLEQPQNLTAYFTLGINRFNGNEFIQLNIDRIIIEDDLHFSENMM